MHIIHHSYAYYARMHNTRGVRMHNNNILRAYPYYSSSVFIRARNRVVIATMHTVVVLEYAYVQMSRYVMR